MLESRSSGAAAAFFYRFDGEFAPMRSSLLVPEAAVGEPFEGMDFDGSLTLILPFSRLKGICSGFAEVQISEADAFQTTKAGMGEDGAQAWEMQVYGKFEDGDEALFSAMEACLGRGALGGLLWFLIVRHLRGFCLALFAGTAASAAACRILYGVFRRGWQVGFALPWRQVGCIAAAAFFVGFPAILLDGWMLRRQDFLESIKRMSIDTRAGLPGGGWRRKRSWLQSP